MTSGSVATFLLYGENENWNMSHGIFSGYADLNI